jgi:hypothetical protein
VAPLTPATQATGSNDVPLVSIDALPVAASSRATHKGTGKVSITANPGWCSITIDGVPRGVTPLGFVELSSGPHHFDCVPPSGKARTATVVVVDASVAHFKFALED